MSSDPVVLSYDDCLLRKSDLQLLTGPHWLNDNIISFYFEYLKNQFKNSTKLLFISPEVTQCVKIMPNEQIDLFLGPLEAKTKNYQFYALNNNESPDSAGGTHWSLLVLSLPERVVYHFDSSNFKNSEIAAHFAKKLFLYFKITGDFIDGQCLQQTNGYDCGIHLLCNCEYLADNLISKSGNEAVIKSFNLKSESLVDTRRNMRKKLLNLITELQKNC